MIGKGRGPQAETADLADKEEPVLTITPARPRQEITQKARPFRGGPFMLACCAGAQLRDHSMILETTPAPTVRPP
ncbi:MAG: hypothetical protein CMI51_10180, partial [Paracoccus sp.]|uniref:hypothetical protein n=1 Tax=Paracoccus sp. TaxID=267 RepID=UPI000C3E3936